MSNAHEQRKVRLMDIAQEEIGGRVTAPVPPPIPPEDRAPEQDTPIPTQRVELPVITAAKEDVLKQTQFNLPVSLNERIARVATTYYTGNRSYFVREVLEEAVSRLEERMRREGRL